MLWFAFKLVSLNHWKQRFKDRTFGEIVVICFQISIFEPLETTLSQPTLGPLLLWFAFKLVSLNHWKQLDYQRFWDSIVVICFQISIFEPLETTLCYYAFVRYLLWFAFKLVSLNHWKQRENTAQVHLLVVICFQISIFEPLETTTRKYMTGSLGLWFAFKLVSLNHWKQQFGFANLWYISCDLLSN